MTVDADLVRLWPLFGLTVTTPRLQLRYLSDGDMAEFARRTDDIHDVDARPFGYPWSSAPVETREPATLQHIWQQRGNHRPDLWVISLGVVIDGEIAGAQTVRADDFTVRRTVSTGSWLNRRWQRQGYGSEMRDAVLHLAFEGLGALRAESGALESNAASNAVSRRAGYLPAGTTVHASEGQRRIIQDYVLEREHWVRRHDITIAGLEPCLAMLGAQ